MAKVITLESNRTFDGTFEISTTLDVAITEDKNKNKVLNWTVTMNSIKGKPWIYMYLDLGVGSGTTRYPFYDTGTYYLWRDGYKHEHYFGLTAPYASSGYTSKVHVYNWNSRSFPRVAGTSQSGTVTLTNSDLNRDITVVLAVEPGMCNPPGTNFSGFISGNIDYATATFSLVQNGSVSIVDNYNNTFTVTGTLGDAGTNNPVSSYNSTLSYNVEGHFQSGSMKFSNSANTFEDTAEFENITIPSSAGASQRVTASVLTAGTYNSTIVDTYADIRHYIKPGKPGTPILNYTKNRLTIKENWKYTWDAAQPANEWSNVVGYRIRLYKDGNELTGLKEISGTNKITKGDGSNTFLNWDNTSCELELDPTDFGFKPKEKVKLSINPYTRYGINNESDIVIGGTTYESSEAIVQSAGVVSVRVLNKQGKAVWKEGQVHIKTNNGWKEADSVNVKIKTDKAANSWKESQ